MKRIILIGLSAVLLFGCSAYKQLKPKPPINPQENGYIELKHGKDLFHLKKEKKYYIEFPAPLTNGIQLVLDISGKSFIHSYLTDTFDDGKGRIVEIPDESREPDHLSVFTLNNSVQKFYWVIDLVKQDFDLGLKYRYVQKWRFRFENGYHALKRKLEDNRVDRSPFEQLGISFTYENVDLSGEARVVAAKKEQVAALVDSVAALEAIFPDNILNTQDSAYLDYLKLKEDTEDELAFQNNYLTVLQLMQVAKESKNNPAAFVPYVDDFLNFYQNQQAFPANVRSAVSGLLEERLPAVTPYYREQLAAKRDIEPIDAPVEKIKQLYTAAEMTPSAGFLKLHDFVLAFNRKAQALKNSNRQVDDLVKEIKTQKEMPGNTYFSGILTRLKKIQYKSPSAKDQAFTPFASYKCVKLLKSAIYKLNRKIDQLLKDFREADHLIPQINAYKAQKNYRGMLRIIKNNPRLSLLKDLYKKVDDLSLNEQRRKIKAAMKVGNWAAAENALKSLYFDTDFLNLRKVKPLKAKYVRALEDTLYNRVARISLKQARAFANAHLETLDNVEELYNDPAFQPVHELTFSARSGNTAQKRMADLHRKLKQIKEIDFPAKAIKTLYGSLIKNPQDKGVAKARAVVVHGRHYQGSDKKTRYRVAECDPWASKWITKPKEYRKIFALPITTNPTGNNEYVFRLNVRIPSRAKFPVYDINIKLPAEVAKKAADKQWYKSITLNKEPIKNEGRFTITSPTKANGYECQITPVRMRKDADNVLEIHFNYPAFKVFEVSVMAQKPIIKKH